MQFQEGAQLALGLVELALAGARLAASSTRSRSEGARSGSRSVCTCSATMKPLRSSERIALSASGSAFAR